MVGLRMHAAFLGVLCLVASELIRILPVCDKECQEHLIFNNYTQAAHAVQSTSGKTVLQVNAKDKRSAQPHAASVLQSRPTQGAGTQQSTVSTGISVRGSAQQHVLHGGAAATAHGRQSHATTEKSVRPSKPPGSTHVFSQPGPIQTHVARGRPVSVVSVSAVQAVQHVQSVAPASISRALGAKVSGRAPGKEHRRSVVPPGKATKDVQVKKASPACKESAVSLVKKQHSSGAAPARLQGTATPPNELIGLFAKVLGEILDKERRFGICSKQGTVSSSGASKVGTSASTCVSAPVQKIGALEQGIRALQWRLQKLEEAGAHAHTVQYIVPQYYPYAYPPYYGGSGYSNPPLAQQSKQSPETCYKKKGQEEHKKAGTAKGSTVQLAEKPGENSSATDPGSTHDSEIGIDGDESTGEAANGTDPRNKEPAHDGGKKMSYEIKRKDAWDEVLRDTREALFGKLKGDIVNVGDGNRKIGGFSFVESEGAEEAAPVPLGIKKSWRKREPLGGREVALPQVNVSRPESYTPVPYLEIIQPGDTGATSQAPDFFSEPGQEGGGAPEETISDNTVDGEDSNDVPHSAAKSHPLYRNLEKLGYREPERGEPLLGLVRKGQDKSAEKRHMLCRGLDFGGSERGSHSDSAEYVYLSDLIRLCR